MISRIGKLLKANEMGKVIVKGWVRTVRQQKKTSFIEVDDGSGYIQVVFPSEKVQNLITGASVHISGELVQGPKALEIQGNSLLTVGSSDSNYPLAKKAHTMEHLRDCVHLRPRTQTLASALRIRSEASLAIHNFFKSKGYSYADFYHIHTPIITGNDCEGAGELFELKNSEDFFGKKAYLTVSGQLHAEIFALALGRVYTFGPTFRAEKSHTQRHLAEFWMVILTKIEPEMIDFTLTDTHTLAADLINHTVKHILNNNQQDLINLSRPIEPLEKIVNNSYNIISYTQAKSITQKNEIGLSTEEERFLTDTHFQGPVVVTNYPKETTPFYMKKNEKFAENFDLLMPNAGEIVGGSVREERLEILQDAVNDKKALEWYLELRKYGTMPHAGFGLGFERLLMMITGIQNVRDIIPVPRTPKNLLC